MPTAQKEAAIREMSNELAGAKGVLLADFTGMDVETVTALRATLRDKGVRYLVVKNTLLKRVCEQRGLTSLTPYLAGPTAVAFSTESEVEPARLLVAFAKQHERPAVKAGMIGERFYTREEILAVAALPGRQELLGQVLGTIVAPLSGFLGCVNALLASPAQLAGELEKQKQG
jgi:large subunit ribosomal protein L10